MRQTSDAVALFEQFLADERVAETPSAVEVVHVQMREGNSKEILQNSLGGTTSVRSSLPLIARNSTG